MGTRHIIAVRLDGKFPVKQYGQWDGYFEGQGQDVLNFLNNPDLDYNKFKDQLSKCHYMTSEELHEMYTLGGVEISEDGFAPYHQMQKFGTTKQGQYLSRDTGAEILSLVYNEDQLNIIPMSDAGEFDRNSWCEYGYVIDLDRNKLDLYVSYNPVGRDEAPYEDFDQSMFYDSFDLDNLPQHFEPQHDDEEEDA